MGAATIALPGGQGLILTRHSFDLRMPPLHSDCFGSNLGIRLMSKLMVFYMLFIGTEAALSILVARSGPLS